jgi:hypothetical protein
VLRAARRLIAEPEHWTTGALARSAAGDEVEPGESAAVCWCAYGALAAVCPDIRLEVAADQALEKAAPTGGGVIAVNDVHGHSAVIALFAAAIEAATP